MVGRFQSLPYTDSMHIPPSQLSFQALRAVVEESVTRDGTDHSAIEPRIEKIMRELEAGRIELHFDDVTQTCNLLPTQESPPTARRHE